MQLKNLSVSKKIWGLLLGVAALLLLAGVVMFSYITRLENVERKEIQDYDHRIRLAVQWRGVTDFAVGNAVLGAMSSEDAISRYAQSKTKESIQAATALQKEIEQTLTSQEGHQQLEKIAQARAKVLAVNADINKLRAAGDVAQGAQLAGQPDAARRSGVQPGPVRSGDVAGAHA